MQLYTIILPNGQTLSSGVPGEDALCRVQLTRSAADTTGMGPGACCAAMLEAEIFYYGDPPIRQGDGLLLYEGQRLVGRFYAEEPKLSGTNRMSLTAYDGVSRLDRDLTGWLTGLEDWPATAWELAEAVCRECGLSLEKAPVPNGDFAISPFTAQATGRRILQWLGQLFGSFLTAQPDGSLRFGWYQDKPQVRIGPGEAGGREEMEGRWQAGDLTLSATGQWDAGVLDLQVQAEESAGQLTLYLYDWKQYAYNLDSLNLAGYTTAPVERVCIRSQKDDVGVAWPRDVEGTAFEILGNPILRAESTDILLPVARSLYERLAGFSYAPLQVTLSRWQDIAPGDRITVTDVRGNQVSTLVMTHRTDRGQLYLESRGNASPESTGAVNAVSLGSLAGKMLQMNLDMDGLRLQNSQTDGALAKLALTVEGIDARVEAQKNTAQGLDSQMAELRMDAQSMQLKLERIQTEGVSRVSTATGYTFDAQGLLICKDGQTMENRLDNTGMYVRRAGNVILQASDAGVKAVDVQVKNYLILGSHSRLEDYATAEDPHRTACFYIEKEEV